MSERLDPSPESSELSHTFWDALKHQGVLTYQRCRTCGHTWLPARHECPNCLVSDWQREPSRGEATLVSWVVFHHAYHPAFESLLPYTVAVVQLDEGPRMISNIVQCDPTMLRIDKRLRLVIDDQGGSAVPRFVLA